jgi:hypothetical protein
VGGAKKMKYFVSRWFQKLNHAQLFPYFYPVSHYCSAIFLVVMRSNMMMTDQICHHHIKFSEKREHGTRVFFSKRENGRTDKEDHEEAPKGKNNIQKYLRTYFISIKLILTKLIMYVVSAVAEPTCLEESPYGEISE